MNERWLEAGARVRVNNSKSQYHGLVGKVTKLRASTPHLEFDFVVALDEPPHKGDALLGFDDRELDVVAEPPNSDGTKEGA